MADPNRPPAGQEVPTTPGRTPRRKRREEPETIGQGPPTEEDAASYVHVGTSGRISTTASVAFAPSVAPSSHMASPRGASSSSDPLGA